LKTGQNGNATLKATLDVVVADITTLRVDAIVNAANRSLLGGGGVDGAIHQAAGPDLLAACRRLNGCATGDAKITEGFKLPSRYVIHAVGPVWHGGDRGEDEALASCYRRALGLCGEYGLTSIAFSAISTGVYGFPGGRAAQIAVDTVRATLPSVAMIAAVTFCCFSPSSAKLHEQALSDAAPLA
jgi:O-acetyl-ADP-ribose deacetylase